jgi:hypothetical protein
LHPDPSRDEEPRSHRGNPAKNVLKDRMMSVLKVQQTERKTDCPGYQKEAGNGGDCPDGAAQLCPDAKAAAAPRPSRSPALCHACLRPYGLRKPAPSRLRRSLLTTAVVSLAGALIPTIPAKAGTDPVAFVNNLTTQLEMVAGNPSPERSGELLSTECDRRA